ncbi:hypothetical protein VU04_07925 [Desulfobulbus sp. TB]|nr:hypothetical protein [Desulfobulbus sp. TB]
MLRVGSNGLDLIKPDDPKPCGAIRVDFTAGHAVFRRKQQDLIGVRPLLFARNREVAKWGVTIAPSDG